MSTPVTCRACNSICVNGKCEICGDKPRIFAPRVPPPPPPAPELSEKERTVGTQREADREWMEQYRKDHPGTSMFQAAMALQQAKQRRSVA